ncbi:MAG: AI-2E family transporter [Candidatus Saccharibacteria bacterium]
MKKVRHIVVVSPLSFLYLLGAIILIWLTIQLSGIILSLIVAGIFAIALNPLVTFLEEKLKIRRGFAVAIVIISIVAVFAFIMWLIIPTTITQAQTLAKNWPSYQTKLKEYTSHNSNLSWGYQRGEQLFRDNTSRISNNLTSISLSLAGGLFSFLTFFVFLIYMLASGRRFAVILSGLLPKKAWRMQFVSIMHDVSNKLGHWLRGQLILCFIVFILSYIGMSILGIDYALTLALFAGLMEAVPMVGAYLGAIPAVAFAFVTTGSIWKTAAVAVLFLVIQQLEGNIIVPQVMKKAVGVHPMIVLLAAMVGGTLLGFVGVLIAVPVTAALSVIFSSMRQYYDDKIEK